MDDFPWPTSAPTGLDDAWTFLDAHPLPADRFELREGGATDEALAAAETALGRPLPAILRRALQRHDGILERWSHSGPFLAGAAEIVAESARFEREWRELEALLADPGVRDEWAENVAKLARRGGGRSPFTLSGLLGYGEMPRISATNMSLVIPVEVNGEEALGLVHTGYAETVVDGSGDPTWISLRFGDSRQPGASHLEVKDVPAITKDLSGLSRGLNAPIKVLLGVNLLRHIHPTFDFEGGQFVVRSFEPPPPPAATTVRVNYVKGGGMVLRSPLGRDAKSPQAALFIDSSMNFPFAFADPGRLRFVLEQAGFVDVSLEDFRTKIHLGRDLDEAMDFQRDVGPVARALAELEGDALERAIRLAREALAPHVTEKGLDLGAACWIATARVGRG